MSPSSCDIAHCSLLYSLLLSMSRMLYTLQIPSRWELATVSPRHVQLLAMQWRRGELHCRVYASVALTSVLCFKTRRTVKYATDAT